MGAFAVSIDTRPIGLPIETLSLATWWPGLDFDLGDQSPAYVGAGGAQSGGTAVVQSSHAYVGAGGAQSGGTAVIQSSHTYVGTGGAQSGGTSLPSYEYVGTGGAQSGGTADVVFVQAVPSLVISGSIRVQTATPSIRVQTATPSIRVQTATPSIRVQLLSKAA